jgi:hypothetical protein
VSIVKWYSRLREVGREDGTGILSKFQRVIAYVRSLAEYAWYFLILCDQSVCAHTFHKRNTLESTGSAAEAHGLSAAPSA